MPNAPLWGVDVSNHQPNWKPSGKENFAFILASDGHSWKSPTHDHQVQISRAAGVPVGHYHWLRPGNIQAQIAWFIKCANPKAGDVLICDWEQSGTTNRDKDDWLKGTKTAQPDNKAVLYCNKNFWLNYDKTSYVGDELWIAAYGVSDPGIQFDWRFWQYADHDGSISLDQNHARFTDKAALLAWARGTQPVSKPPAVTIIEPIQPTAGSIHTPFGQWGRYWSWNKGKNKAHPTWGQHGGDDWYLDAKPGHPIIAVADGTIIYAGDARKTDAGWGKAFGIHVLNQWDTGGRTSLDGHMIRLAPGIKAGKKVKAGDLIGYLGKTGNVTGYHVHHEQHLGTRWTDKRVKPIYPGKKTTITKPTDPRGKDPAMGKLAKFRRRKPQKFSKSNSFRSLVIDDGNDKGYSVTSGPGRIRLYANISADQDVWARFVTMDWKPGKVRTVTPYPDVFIKKGGGELSLIDEIGGPASGWKSRIVRLQVKTPNGCTVSDVLVRAEKE